MTSKKTFVQIGANDGKTWDSFCHEWFPERELWNGLFVEPEPIAFRQLVQTFKDIEGMRFENSAIYSENCKRKFYICSRDMNNYDKFSTLSSFDRNHIIKHNIEEKYIHETEVNCLTFDSLVQKHEISDIDYLIIDTEGYDLKVLEGIDFDKILPKKIRYEHKHLSVEDKKKAIRMLLDRYSMLSYDKDNGVFVLE